MLTGKRFGAIALPLLSLSAVATVLSAEEEAAVFAPEKDVVLAWALRACLIVTVLSLALIILVLVFRHRRLMESSSKWLLFIGICVLPLPVALLSSGIGMEESKSVDFCHSCHAPMDPFVDDMKNGQSDTLAAQHFKNRYIQRDHCWTCHSDYGIAGTAGAKAKGLTHIYKFTTKSWHAPIALYEPYQWAICLGCHAESNLFKAPRNDATAHEGVLEAVMKKEMGCTDCHDMAHPGPEQRSH